ncbi:hypothetical protein [Trinickia sp.]|uniref:hypothetical protein n=1 Tax=Trinickia sp. TaxID=2571163 RepID=UPI003F7EBD5D
MKNREKVMAMLINVSDNKDVGVFNQVKINAEINEIYMGGDVTKKYTPLHGVSIFDNKIQDVTRLIRNRIDLIKNKGMWAAGGLKMLCTNWQQLQNEANGRRETPPFVVISANRSENMKKWLWNAKILEDLPKGYIDPTTFNMGPSPWYAPQRSGHRLVYVVVHWTEFIKYRAALREFDDVRVVGYGGHSGDKRKASELVGFGASRYAAMKLVTTLGYDWVWMVDDNVVHVNAFPRTLAEVENKIMSSNCLGMGPNGDTKFTEVANIHSVEFNEPTNEWTIESLDNKDKLMQQVMFWHVSRLVEKELFYSPIFVTSNEDSSFCYYLRRVDADYGGVATEYAVKKCVPQFVDEPWTKKAPSRDERLDYVLKEILLAGEKEMVLVVTKNEMLDQFLAGANWRITDAQLRPAHETHARAIEQVMMQGITHGCDPAGCFSMKTAPPQVEDVPAP